MYSEVYDDKHCHLLVLQSCDSFGLIIGRDIIVDF